MHESGCWGDYCERRYSGANSHFQRGLSDEGRNRRKNRRVCCAGSFTTVRSAGCCGSFSGGRKWEGVKQRRGLIFGVNFPECLEAQAKSRRHPGDMHGFLQLCLMVLAEAGTSKSPGGAGAGLQRYQRILASARARNPVATGKSGERTGRGNLSNILHRRVPSGYGDRRGVLL